MQWLDVNYRTARRINLVDNRGAELGGYDDVALALLLEQVGAELAGTGWDAATVAEFAALTGPVPTARRR